ncbi:MAG: hypothetical protein A2X22_04505 [Bacteroidetes bacterium GWF2_49_14]|nr:MAG: hypothetical protein A2X22_04505 [Bacteroidetes bacterium GWF2_49_14]HBB92736.1 hypothetical protein [Bacteroidales bacterium]
MIVDISLSELFDRYLEDDLNILDRQEIELRLAQDPAFANRFKLHKEIDQAVMESEIMQFRKQLEMIQTDNPDLVKDSPMEVARFFEPEIDRAILEEDVMSLRNQLSRIHASIIDDVDASEIPGYAIIEEAIINQDAVVLQAELKEFTNSRLSGALPEELEGIKLSREIDQALLEEDVMELREKLTAIGDQVTGKTLVVSSRRKIITTITSIAAVLTFLISGTIVLMQNPTISGNQRLSGMFENYGSISESRGPVDAVNKITNTAVHLYNNKQYPLAGPLFDVYLEQNDSDDEVVKVYAGHCALETNDPDKGIRYLSSITSEAPAYIDAQWYLAGCYLRKDQPAVAIDIIEKLSKNDKIDRYPYPIEKLLKKLRKVE